jgi:hypothetical protein
MYLVAVPSPPPLSSSAASLPLVLLLLLLLLPLLLLPPMLLLLPPMLLLLPPMLLLLPPPLLVAAAAAAVGERYFNHTCRSLSARRALPHRLCLPLRAHAALIGEARRQQPPRPRGYTLQRSD